MASLQLCNPAKAEQILKTHPEYEGKSDFVTVSDYAREGTWNQAFQTHEFDHVIHTAAPLLDNPGNTDFDRDFSASRCQRLTVEDAQKAPNPYISYYVSKEEAEKAIWKFMDKNKPHFTVSVLLPALIFGPPIQPISDIKKINYSTDVFYFAL